MRENGTMSDTPLKPEKVEKRVKDEKRKKKKALQ